MSSIVHSTSEAVETPALPKASPPESVPERVGLPITAQVEESGKPYVAKYLDWRDGSPAAHVAEQENNDGFEGGSKNRSLGGTEKAIQ